MGDFDPGFFRKLLEQKRDELLSRKKNQRDFTKTVELDQTRMGRLSRMDALQQQAIARDASLRSAAELKRIDEALRRIRSGDYGLCVRCGERIAEKRLSFDPAVLTCITCAGRGEKERV